MDYLDFFEDVSDVGSSQQIEEATFQGPIATSHDDGKCKLALNVSSPQHELVQLRGRGRQPIKKRKVWYYSKGSPKDRKGWNLDMQLRRSIARRLKQENDILGLLTSLQTRANTSSIRLERSKKGLLFSRSGLVKMAHLKIKSKGNRYEMKWGLQDFLIASFGDDTSKGKRVQGRNSTALHLKMDPSTVSYMRAVSFGAVMARQSATLARIYLLCKSTPPVAVGVREAFDETSQKLVVQGQPGEWQIMVLKKTLLIAWDSVQEDQACILKVPVAAWHSKHPVTIPACLCIALLNKSYHIRFS